MTAATYDAAMVRVFADEGGYTNDPSDPGGPTNWGITIFDARKYWKSSATAADVRAMPKDVASNIYKQHYAIPIRYDDLPAGFDYSVLDAEINSGIGRAIPWAETALGSSLRSLDDIVTRSNAANDKVSLIQKYWALRLSFLHGLSTWGHFGAGWGRRVAQGEAAAVRMWLSIGAALPASETRARLDQEAAKAKAKVSSASTGAASTGAATTIGAPALDPSHLSMGGKIALGFAIAGAIALVIYLVSQIATHNQRAAAYAAA